MKVERRKEAFVGGPQEGRAVLALVLARRVSIARKAKQDRGVESMPNK